MFYWATILFSQTLGTALGDWMADTNGLGYSRGALVFGAGLVVIAALYFFTKTSRTALFWSAFILTRPLGATIGDLLDKPVADGGLAVSRFYASAILAVVIVVCILGPAANAPANTHEAPRSLILSLLARDDNDRLHRRLDGPCAEFRGHRVSHGISRFLKAVRRQRLDLAAHRRALAKADRGIAMRRCATGQGDDLEVDPIEARLAELATDGVAVVMAVRGAREEARRVGREDAGPSHRRRSR